MKDKYKDYDILRARKELKEHQRAAVSLRSFIYRKRTCKHCKVQMPKYKRRDSECCSTECSYKYRIKVYGAEEQR